MEKQLFIERPVTILDLGTGFSNIHLNVADVINDSADENISKFSADVIRIENPATRDRIISAIIKEQFSYDFREAALRKGIENNTDPDYVAFNIFAEEVKRMVSDAGII